MLAIAANRLKAGAIASDQCPRQNTARVWLTLTSWLATEDVLGLHTGNEGVCAHHHIHDFPKSQL